MGYRKIRSFICWLLAVVTPFVVVAGEQQNLPERGELKLSDIWQVQPAVSVNNKPVEGDWANMKTRSDRSGDWRYQNFKRDKTSWAKADKKSINSLWYRQNAVIPKDWKGRKIFLNFDFIQGDAIVFINGDRVAELLRPGGDIEVGAKLNYGGNNELLVFLTRDYTDISRGFKDDVLRYISRTHTFGAVPTSRWALGISGSVSFRSVSGNGYIKDIFVRTSWRKKELNVQTEIKAFNKIDNLSFKVSVYDADDKQVLEFTKKIGNVEAGDHVFDLAEGWKNFHPWELDDGYLHSVRVVMSSGKEILDAPEPVNFGFREIWAEGRELLLNGHPLRLRMTINFGITTNALKFYKLMGFNATYFQNNPSSWWRDWTELPVVDNEKLTAMDKEGFACSLSAGNVMYIRENLLNDPRVREAYQREVQWHMRRYRNHPGILFWTLGMNSYNPREAIAPQGMGRREEKAKGKRHVMEEVIETASSIVKKFDPTRLNYSHADGNLADIASANVYLNFAPLQEREEWPSAWAAKGNMPYMAAEFGQPYTANFWKKKRCLLTEYFAMYFGEQAYKQEGEKGLADTIRLSLANHGHGAFREVDIKQFPLYWDFQKLFVGNTNRAYRTWGYNGGWAYWNLDTVYGNPPAYNAKNRGQFFSRYELIKKPVTGIPDWASPNFYVHRQANLPLLVYIAGWPVHTDKTHSYYSGQIVRKNIAIVWDGPGDCNLTGEWSVSPTENSGNAKEIKATKISVALKPGDIKLIPVEFVLPALTDKTGFDIIFKGYSDKDTVVTDKFSFNVFPEIASGSIKHEFRLYDPQQKSVPWLKSLGVKFSEWKTGDKLRPYDILIIGREALKPGQVLPYNANDIEAGGKVLILEQQPEVWKGLGLRIQQVMPRYVFAASDNGGLFSGLDEQDLRNWAGSPNLLAAGKNQPVEARHAPKWTNTHAVSSVMLQAPRSVGFTPLIRCGFDLDYSPLLQWSYGKGGIWFSALDLTERVCSGNKDSSLVIDPAASKLAFNLLAEISSEGAQNNKNVYYFGGEKTRNILVALGVNLISNNSNVEDDSVVIVGEEADISVAQINKFVQQGVQVLVMPQAQDKYKEQGVGVIRQKLERVNVGSTSYLNGIKENLLRWRDELDVFKIIGGADIDIFADGVLGIKKAGKGSIIYLQVSPLMLKERYAKDTDKAQAIQTSVWRLEQLLAQLLTNIGVKANKKQADRLAFLDLGPQFQVIKHWNVLGPFDVDKEDGKLMLETVFPGEETAIAGDFNPNNTFVRKDGAKLDWRKTIKADAKGFVNMGAALGKHSLAVGYVIASVKSENSREAVLRLGADWRLKAWVNGKPIFKTMNGLNKVGAYKIRIKLEKGENLIALKVGSGSKGFGFFADISSECERPLAVVDNTLKDVSLYSDSSPADEFDPYEFFYW